MELLSSSGDPLIPELDEAIANPEKHVDSETTRRLFDQGASKLSDIQNIPHLTYTTYRNVQRFTDRLPYQAVRGIAEPKPLLPR